MTSLLMFSFLMMTVLVFGLIELDSVEVKGRAMPYTFTGIMASLFLVSFSSMAQALS